MNVRSQTWWRKYKGFTLIELLIVVLIIAVLAAIAVPNFLEFNVRAKVSRVKSDQRTIAVAIESYAVDNGVYPFSDFSYTLQERLCKITTPIAYLSTLPADPFKRPSDTAYGEGSVSDPTGAYYLYNTGQTTVGTVTGGTIQSRSSWSLTSAGPDVNLDFPYWPFGQNFLNGDTWQDKIYDPTNGTVSRGDIFLRGGSVPKVIPAIDARL